MAFEIFKVLIIDDDEITHQIYGRLLNNLHYKVLGARDGIEGLQKAFRELPDVILLDIMMPGLSGHEVCASLRAAPRTSDIPIIMLTSLDGVDARRKAQEVGADDFITKTEQPIENVEGRMKMLLKKRVQTHTRSWVAGLPGSVTTDYVLQQQVDTGQAFAICQFEVNNFAAYNNLLGYKQGERLLWSLARALNHRVIDEGAGSDFVGYYNWDTFVVVTTPKRAPTLAEQILTDFEHMMVNDPSFSEAKQYRPHLAGALVTINESVRPHLGQIYDKIRMLLQEAKSQGGNTLCRGQL